MDYKKMKSQTMSVLSNPTIISYSLIFCSTLILGYYTLHDSQAFKSFTEEKTEEPKTEESKPEEKSSFGFPSFGSSDKKEEPPAPAGENSSFNLFGSKPEEAPKPDEGNIFGSKPEAPKPEEVPKPEAPKPEEAPPAMFGSEKPDQNKPPGVGGKKSRRKRMKKSNKSKKHHKL